MQAAQRTAVRSLRQLRPQFQRQTRRNASDSLGHGHAAPSNESFGLGFYLTLAAFPTAYIVYRVTRSDGENSPYFTRMIKQKYDEYKQTFERRNEIHTNAMEQAAADRVLFFNEASRNIRHVELKFPEQFNQGSPWNVPAGQGHANIDTLIAKYRREANEREEEKMQRLRENRVPCEQPLEPLSKVARR